MKNHFSYMLLCFILSHSAFARAQASVVTDQQSLQGRWFQPCLNQVVRIEDFEGSDVTLTESFFSDAQCQTPVLVFLNEGTYVLPQSQWMDFRFSAVKIRVVDANLVTSFNQKKMCGISDWKANEERNISGQLCEIFFAGQKAPAAGDMRYGIYRLDQDRLMFGQLSHDHDATTPDKRPTDWDPSPYIKMPHQN